MPEMFALLMFRLILKYVMFRVEMVLIDTLLHLLEVLLQIGLCECAVLSESYTVHHSVN